MAPRRSSSPSSYKRRTNKKSKQRRPTAKKSERFVCIFCDSKWPQYAHLEVHMTKHTRERPYQCHKCDANYSLAYSLNAHINNVHLGKRYYCNLCPLSYTLPSNLKNHKRIKHHSQSKRVIFNGIRKITKNIGILKGKRNKIKKVSAAKDPKTAEDSKMPVATKKPVPTTSLLLNLVNSLQKATERKRKISTEENKDVLVEVKEEISEENEEPVVEIKDKAVVEVTEEVIVKVKEEIVEDVEDITEPLVSSSTSNQNDNLSATDDVVSVKQENDEDNQPLPPPQQNTSVPVTNEKEGANQNKTLSQTEEPKPSTSEFPILTKVPFVGGPYIKPNPSYIYNRPPEPPPNLMFYFNGNTVPVLSLDILRHVARSNYRQSQTVPSPPSSQSSSSDPDSDYIPPTTTSSRKQSTKPSRKKSEPEPSTSSKPRRQSTKVEDKKTSKSRTKSSLKMTATTDKTKLKGRRNPGPASRNGIKCEECGDAFQFPSQLVVHKLKHTGERPHPCTICGTRFTRRGNLIQHLANVHSQKNSATIKVEDIKTERSSES